MSIVQNLDGLWDERKETTILRKHNIETSIENIIAFRTMLELGNNSVKALIEQAQFIKYFNIIKMPFSSIEKMKKHLDSGIIDFHIEYGFIPLDKNFYMIRNKLFYLDWGE